MGVSGVGLWNSGVLLGLGALELYWAAPAGSTAPTTGAATYVSEDLTHEGIRWFAYLGGGVLAVMGVGAMATGLALMIYRPN